MSSKVDFEVFGTEEYSVGEETKTRWTRLGVAFVNADSISVKLSAYPTNPSLVLLKPKPKDDGGSKGKLDVFGG